MFDYAYARKHGGQFLVRIEDTDRARFVEGAEEVVLNAMSWFGLEEDESPRKGGPFAPYRQSERLAIYQRHARELVENGHAFYCFCSKERLEEMRKKQEENKEPPRYDGHCSYLGKEEVEKRLDRGEAHVIRMKIPEHGTVRVKDELLGEVSFESDTLDMQVLLKADGFPTYHLAVVIDDYLMHVTHIFRGREWLPSTPKHVLLYQYFGWELPKFVHLPIILNAQGPGKLSKRNGHASVQYYIDGGFLPEAILNYLSLIVWKHPEGKEIYGLDEFVKNFEIKDVTSQGPKFDLAKLTWLNGQWIRQLSEEDLSQRLCETTGGKAYTECNLDQVKLFLPLVRERISKLSDFDDLVYFLMVDSVLDVVKKDFPEVVELESKWRELMQGTKLSENDVRKIVAKVVSDLESRFEDLHGIEASLREWFAGEGYKLGDAFMVVRVALTGRTATPPLWEIVRVLGREKTLARLKLV
jgi:glutamyl-tRNA synthetase